MPMIPVSVIIYTLNEEVNLRFCLDSLDWCDDVVVVDSYSDDATEAIAREYGVRFFQHQFEGFGTQRNWSLKTIRLHHDWVLILDADERVPAALVSELGEQARRNDPEIGAYRLRRRFYMWGKWLKYSSLYPTWVVRFIHKDRVRFINRGHAETQEVDGRIKSLRHDLIDENHKGIQDWFDRQNRYSSHDAEYELFLEKTPLHLVSCCSSDPLKRRASAKRLVMNMPFRPVLFFLYSYFFRLGFLDGRAGLEFCLLKAVYQRMILAKKYSFRHGGRQSE